MMLSIDTSDITLDESVFLKVYSNEDEFIFEMPLNKKELINLKEEINISLKFFKKHEKLKR